MTPIGWRLWYADGTVVDSRTDTWASAPSTGVQVLAVYYAETYECWHGRPERGGQKLVHNYRSIYHGAKRQIDYYWITLDGVAGAGSVDEIPVGAVVKEGTLIATDRFQDIVNAAQQEYRFEV